MMNKKKIIIILCLLVCLFCSFHAVSAATNDLNNTKELADYINNMILEIKKHDDDILREVSIKKLSDETGIDINLLRSKITKENKVEINIQPKIITKLNKYQKSERNLIYYMLLDKTVIKM